MNDNELFWERVNAALDERRDPLRDERVQMLVAEDPARLEELLALRERVATLADSRPRRRISRVAAAAVVVIAAASVWFVENTVPQQFVPDSALATATPNATNESGTNCCGTVFSFHAHIVTESADSRTTIDFDGERVLRSREVFSPSNDDAARSQLAFVALVDSSSFVR